MDTETTTFRIPFRGHNLFAQSIKAPSSSDDESTLDASQTLVVVVHGGPGLSDHTEVFAGLKPGQLPAKMVVFFDQLGCGQSDAPDPEKDDNDNDNAFDSLYSLSGHVDQLKTVLEYCRVHFPAYPRRGVLGHSWGGQIVLEWLLQPQDPTKSADSVDFCIISNTPLDEQSYQHRQIELRQALDPEIRKFYEEEEEQTAKDTVTIKNRIFQKLIGVSETNITGDLQHWSVQGRLDQLLAQQSPRILFVATKDDTISYRDYAVIQANPPHNVVVMENGGHGPFFGPTAHQYFSIVQSFVGGEHCGNDKV